jgi:predicted RNA binding protein YcfA (HicA-like mRNA interferase family)
LKNWNPRDVVRFLKKNGFVDIDAKGDHCGLHNPETGAYTEVDWGKNSFSQREMKSFICQSKIAVEHWKKGKKVKVRLKN